MRVLLRVGLCLLVAECLMAQRGGGGHGGGGGGGRGGGTMGGGAIGGGRGGLGGGFGGYGGFRGGYGSGYGRYGYGYGLAYGWGYPYGLYYGDPYDYYDSYGYAPYISNYSTPYEYSPSPNVTIIYPQQPAPPPAPAPVQPVVRSYDQYGQEAGAAQGSSLTNGSPIYLIATKDQVIRAAMAYWVEGRTLHFVTMQHEEKQVPLDTVDRPLSLQLNRERRVAFQLPQ